MVPRRPGAKLSASWGTTTPRARMTIQNKLHVSRPALYLACCACALLCGCGGIGPRTIAYDRFDYTETLSASWKQQMLVNMVKLRYADTPVFLDVVSVINQYSIEPQVHLRLDGVLVDDRDDVEEHRRVRVAQLYHVDEHLLLPRARQRLRVIKAVIANRPRPDPPAAAKQRARAAREVQRRARYVELVLDRHSGARSCRPPRCAELSARTPRNHRTLV
jgi:hypothetical protein